LYTIINLHLEPSKILSGFHHGMVSDGSTRNYHVSGPSIIIRSLAKRDYRSHTRHKNVGEKFHRNNCWEWNATEPRRQKYAHNGLDARTMVGRRYTHSRSELASVRREWVPMPNLTTTYDEYCGTFGENEVRIRRQTWNNIDLSRSLLPHEFDIQTAISPTRMMLERNAERPLPPFTTQKQESGEIMTRTIPLSLPTCLARSIDKFTMTAHQYFLRQQIEVFQANEEDVSSHIRGRNKPIILGQVGIRCRHCAHVPVMRRQKGSTYYPSNKYGIYQAAQNMSTSHMQCGLCSEMPNSVKMQFARILTEKK